METEQTREEKLREEFKVIGSGSVRFMATRDEVSNFWLSKRKEELAELKEKVTKLPRSFIGVSSAEGELGLVNLKDVLQIIKSL